MKIIDGVYNRNEAEIYNQLNCLRKIVSHTSGTLQFWVASFIYLFRYHQWQPGIGDAGPIVDASACDRITTALINARQDCINGNPVNVTIMLPKGYITLKSRPSQLAPEFYKTLKMQNASADPRAITEKDTSQVREELIDEWRLIKEGRCREWRNSLTISCQ